VVPHRADLGRHVRGAGGAGRAARRLPVSLLTPAPDSMTWLLDNNGEPRITTTVDKGVSTIYYRDPANNNAWRKLISFNTYTGGKEMFTPLAFGPDGTLYVVANGRKDKSAVHTYDFAADKMSDKPLIELEGYDFRGHLIMNKDAVLGVRHLMDAQGTTWFDDGMKAMQAKIDSMLPNTVNLLTLPTRPASPWVLVTAFSDLPVAHPAVQQRDQKADHGRRHLSEDRGGKNGAPDAGALQGARRPGHSRLADRAARRRQEPADGGAGARRPVCARRMPGAGIRPQFLASRGYAVLEPEFRGSTGFGSKHFRAGWKQWGLKMQDDIADGTRWAIAAGHRRSQAHLHRRRQLRRLRHADGPDQRSRPVQVRRRLGRRHRHQPAVRRPLEFHLRPAGRLEAIRHAVADRRPGQGRRAAEGHLAALQAARIKQPLLLAYGGADQRVPLYHGTKFYKAVKEPTPTSNGSSTRRKATAGRCRRTASTSGAGSRNSSTRISASRKSRAIVWVRQACLFNSRTTKERA
jgi:hypothetical protein